VKYTAETASSDMIYISVFMNIGSGNKKLIRAIHRQHGYHLSLLHSFKIKQVG
jgi:hypothetical protein